MRLLSFLTEIERALNAESPAVDGGAWTSTRMINFGDGLARLGLEPRVGNDFPGGVIFLQAFSLADGSLCLKASLNWHGSEHGRVMSVYTLPAVNWKLEASGIATAWIEGPQVMAAQVDSNGAFAPLAATG